jgi:hypothetical protein
MKKKWKQVVINLPHDCVQVDQAYNDTNHKKKKEKKEGKKKRR